MATKGKAAKTAGTVAAARTQSYVRRFIDDEGLRDNIRTAFESARVAYGRLNGKAPHKALLEDKKLQKSLQQAATSLRDAQSALSDGPKKKKRGLGGVVFLALVGGVAAVALSEGLRTKVLDALFGKEEEFEYTSTTAPPTEPPTAPPTAAPPGS